MITRFMERSQTVITQKKKRGPPATGKGTLIGVRLQPPDLAELDASREDMTRPEAIRQLVKLGLKAKRKRGR
jgi:hypothetical protein